MLKQDLNDKNFLAISHVWFPPRIFGNNFQKKKYEIYSLTSRQAKGVGQHLAIWKILFFPHMYIGNGLFKN